MSNNPVAMKLVSAMLVSGAVITASAMTSDILGQPLSEAALMHIENELDKAVGKVDRNRSPLFNDLSQMINETMSPAILTAHTSAQTQLDGFRTAFEACTPPVVSNDGSGAGSKAISDKLEEHRQCRQREQKARSGAEECDKQLSQGQVVKDSACAAVPGSDGTLPPLDQQGHVGCKVTPNDYEGWLNSFDSQVKSLKTQFDEAKGGCGNASQLVDDMMPKCVAANQSIGQNKTACDALQSQADQMACSSDPVHASQCGAYTSCYDTAKKNYLDANESIAAAQVNRTAQWRVLKRMQCLLTEESAGASHEGIDACRNQTIDTSHLDLVYPDIPSKEDCTVDEGLEDHPLPCSGDWIKLYGELASPAAPCTPCPMCTDVEPVGLVYRISSMESGVYVTLADKGCASGTGGDGLLTIVRSMPGGKTEIWIPSNTRENKGSLQCPGWGCEECSQTPIGEWRFISKPEYVGRHGFKRPHVIESVTEPGRYLIGAKLPDSLFPNLLSWFLCGTAEQLQASGTPTSAAFPCDTRNPDRVVDVRRIPTSFHGHWSDTRPGVQQDVFNFIIVHTSGMAMSPFNTGKQGGYPFVSGINTNKPYRATFLHLEPVFDANKGYIIESTEQIFGSPVYWQSNGWQGSGHIPAEGPVLKLGRTLTDLNVASDEKFSQFKFLPPPAGFEATQGSYTGLPHPKFTSQRLIQDAFSPRFVEQKLVAHRPIGGTGPLVRWTPAEVTWNVQMTELGQFDLQQAGVPGAGWASSRSVEDGPYKGMGPPGRNWQVGLGTFGSPVFVEKTGWTPMGRWYIKEASCMPYGHKPKCATGSESISVEDKGASYRGCQAVTKSGRTCQAWNSQSPHTHTNTYQTFMAKNPGNSAPNGGQNGGFGPETRSSINVPGGYGGSGLFENNFCRNPDNSATIWCYTTDPKQRWEACEPIA